MNELEERKNETNINDLQSPVVNETEVNQIIPTVNTVEVTESAPKNKKSIKKYWYVILIVLIILGVGGYLIYKNLNKEDSQKENADNKQQDIIYKDYEYDSFALSNYQKNENGEYIYKEVYEPNEIVSFNLIYEMNNGYEIKELSYKLNYGSGLKLIDDIYDGECLSYSTDKDITHMTVAKECAMSTGSFGDITKEYQFKILDGYTSKDLYVEITDIKFKTIGNEYFEYPNIRKNITLKSDKYYIYKENTDDYLYLRVSDTELNQDDLTKVGEYKCDSKDCEYISNEGNYVLFDDFGLVAYNYKTKKVEELKFNGNVDRVNQLVADDKIYGIIVEKDGKSGYYSLEYSKYIIPLKEENSLYYDSYGFIENRAEEYQIIDPKGNEFKPEISKLDKIDGTEFYYYTYYCGIEDCSYKFYTAEGVEIASAGNYWGYTITENKDILLIDKSKVNESKFEIYDSKGNKIYTSKNYKGVYSLHSEDYLAIIDNDNYLKLINSKEEILATFTEMTEGKYFHNMISGWYEYDNKNGVYLVVQDPSVTVEEVLENNKDYTQDDIEWIKESSGYEYYYIPSTGETGKIPTAIGGYAKPVLYLYPEKDDTKINITFEKPGLLTTTYPKFNRSWNVTANKNGDLYDEQGKYYYGLYWEESGSTKVDFSEGFYVTKDSAIDFLEEKLSIIGLSDRERNEFIMYWLPILEKNEKNLVYFELTEEREKFNKLNISPKPDSLLRMAIHVKKVNKKTNIKEQKLKTFNRNGFTAVEWGGVIH